MNIYITPQNEEKLREYASVHPNYSMSGLINLLLDNHFEQYGTGKETGKESQENRGGTKIPETPYLQRTKQDVLTDIKKHEQLKEDNIENQDPDFWAKWRESHDILWKEYNSLAEA